MKGTSKHHTEVSLFEKVNNWYWEDLARQHEFICTDLSESVIRGSSTLRNIELQAVGDPYNKKLLHLMCHLGHDSISWSRLGAKVTAVDASKTALESASQLAKRSRQNVNFIQIQVPYFPAQWSNRFDVVLMTYGVLSWIPNLTTLARACAACLSPGGILVVVDDHPLASFLCLEGECLVLRNEHLEAQKASVPERYRTVGSYLDRNALIRTPLHYRWHHTVNNLQNAIKDAGLVVDRLSEYPFSHYRRFSCLLPRPDGYYEPSHPPPVPLLVEVTAFKPY